MLSCQELFTIFNKIGGEFICKYDTNQGILLPQNIKCNNLHQIGMELDVFLFENAYMYSKIIKEVKLDKNSFPQLVHTYQDFTLQQIHIKFSVDDLGYREPPREAKM